MSLKIIEQWYSKLPPYEVDMPLIRLDTTVYTPRQILDEVRRKTPVGTRLQTKVEGLRFGSTLDDEVTAEERLIKLLEERPIRIAALVDPDIGKEEFSSKELIERIKKKDKIGKSMLKTEIEHMTAMMKV